MQNLTECMVKSKEPPWIIQIENTAYCNRKCVWCPQSKLEFMPDQRMKWIVLEQIIEDLVAMNYRNRIHPYGNGEPLTDPEFIDRIKYIKERLPECYQYISTNGDMVDKNFTFDQIFEAGVNNIQCNHYDDKNRRLKLQKPKKGRLDHFDIGFLRPTFYNRAGNIKMVNMTPSAICWFPGRKLYFNFLGDMLICCSDWQCADSIGSIKDKNLPELLASPKLRKYQEYLENNRSSELPLCSKCNQIKQTQEVI